MVVSKKFIMFCFVLITVLSFSINAYADSRVNRQEGQPIGSAVGGGVLVSDSTSPDGARVEYITTDETSFFSEGMI